MSYDEEEDRAYREWEMKQPGYWRDRFIVALFLFLTFSSIFVALIGSGIIK